jgi:hypothetical protein
MCVQRTLTAFLCALFSAQAVRDSGLTLGLLASRKSQGKRA